MKPQLVLQLPSAELSAETIVHWAIFDEDGRLQASDQAALSAVRSTISRYFRDGEIRVLVPGELVLLTKVRIPTKQLRHIKQALPYMVEEMIADNIEEVHLALPAGKLDWDGEVPVAVVRHHLLINWLDQLFHHGIKPDFLGPDTLAMPWREHSRSYFAVPAQSELNAGTDNIRVLYRDDRYCGQVVALDNLPVLLAAQPAELVDGVGHLAALTRYVASGGADVAAAVQQMSAQLQKVSDGDIDVAPFVESSAEVLAATAVREREQVINLLQGGYRVQRRNHNPQIWSRVASVAAIGLVVYALVAGGSGWYFSSRAQQTEAQSLALYRELFPGERRVVSPKKQMANHLRGSGQAVAESLLPLLAKAAAGFGVDDKTRIDELRFNQQQKNLQVQLRTPSLEVLEQIKKRLDASGLNVDIGSAVEQGNTTVGRMQIREQKS
jgi:general secretion pathway protein L